MSTGRRRRRTSSSEAATKPLPTSDNTEDLQPRSLLGEDFDGPPPCDSAVELSKTAALAILGEKATGRVFVVQHGRGAVNPGHAAELLVNYATNHNPRTGERTACHVVRFENGQIDYVPTKTPGYDPGQAPKWLRWSGAMYIEWIPEFDEDGAPNTQVARIVGGRPIE
jgi:hypothetical protein